MTENVLNVVTFCWLALWAIRSFLRIAAGESNSILSVIIMHFVLSGVPLILDVLVRKPMYVTQVGFFYASRDEHTSIVYCLYVCACALFWWWFGQPRENHKSRGTAPIIETDEWGFLQRWRFPAVVALISPPVAVVFAPDIKMYFAYALIPFWLPRPEVLAYHTIITLLTSLSILGAATLLMASRRISISTFILLLPWLAIAVWLNGKRGILFILVILLGYVLWYRGYLRGMRLAIAIPVAVSLLLAFSLWYQSTVRELGLRYTGVDRTYDNMRIDFFRDDAIKMAIFAELNSDKMQILEHRGQSLLFYVTMYVPRKFWPDKPLPYAQYFTSAMLGTQPRLWGWGVTTSWLGEALSNLGWFGLLAGPLLIALICRVGDNCNHRVVSAMTMLIANAFLSVHLVAFAPIFLLWILMVLLTRGRSVEQLAPTTAPNLLDTEEATTRSKATDIV